jgi:mevalonate kinase
MKRICVSAPGKLHLLGEHSAVYGKPAVIATVNKRCFVTISSRKDNKIEIILSDLNINKIVMEKEIIKKTNDAQKKWKAYVKNNDISVLKSITSSPLDFPIIIIGETLKYLKKTLPVGIALSVKSDIPIGSGMGSSAALSVSIAGAIYLLFNKKFNKEIINEIAYSAEFKRHGLPSGGDNSTICFGGLVWYRKESAELKIIKPISFSLSEKMAGNFCIIQTGTPDELTGEMVGLVRVLYKKRPKLVEDALSSQEVLTRELLPAIKSNDEQELIRIIRDGEKNLEKLGVVSVFAKSIMRKIEKIGGAAKICGGGGIKKGTGVLLAYHQDPSVLRQLLLNSGLKYSRIQLGTEGLKIEKNE